MIREMTAQDEKRYLDMGQEFYSSNAVLHPIPREIYHKNFQEMLQGSPYIKGYIIEKDGQTAGYMILSFTYSSEVGGMVVLITAGRPVSMPARALSRWITVRW